MNLANIKKFLAALAGAVGVAVTAGLIDGTAEKWTVGIISAATAFIVFYVPNSPAAPAAGDHEAV